LIKKMKPGHTYFIINCDEPFAGELYNVLKFNMQRLGRWPEGDITFLEWHKQTFGVALQDVMESAKHPPTPANPATGEPVDPNAAPAPEIKESTPPERRSFGASV